MQLGVSTFAHIQQNNKLGQKYWSVPIYLFTVDLFGFCNVDTQSIRLLDDEFEDETIPIGLREKCSLVTVYRGLCLYATITPSGHRSRWPRELRQQLSTISRVSTQALIKTILYGAVSIKK